jgi:phospholipid/cholesterol/gamma-HCH transport system substrate-binding protein
VETTSQPVPEPPNLSQEQLLQQLRDYREQGKSQPTTDN